MSHVVKVPPNATTVVTLDGWLTLAYDDRWLAHLVETRAPEVVKDTYQRVSLGEAYNRILGAVGRIRDKAALGIDTNESELASALTAFVFTAETVARANAKNVASEKYNDELTAAKLIVAQLDDETAYELASNVGIHSTFIGQCRDDIRSYLATCGEAVGYAVKHARKRLSKIRLQAKAY